MTTDALIVSAILFAIGTVGVLTRKNAIVLFMCVELMLNAVNLSFIALSRLHGTEGQVFVVLVMTVAAAEAAIGLALVIAVFRHIGSVDLSSLKLLKG
jgi:NADH-quinone oxidoreductase subunit K